MKVSIIIASHISSLTQSERLRLSCINSLLDQTMEAQIILSISFKTKSLHDTLCPLITDFVSNYANMEIHAKTTRMSQMMHIYSVLHRVEDSDLIMFCDDDDFYHPQRVELMSKNYEQMKSAHTDTSITGIRELYHGNQMTEFWSYGITFNVLFNFFKLFSRHMYLLEHNYGDVYLRLFLGYGNKDGQMVEIIIGEEEKPLYTHTINSESITYKVTTSQLKIGLDTPIVGKAREALKCHLLISCMQGDPLPFQLELGMYKLRQALPENEENDVRHMVNILVSV